MSEEQTTLAERWARTGRLKKTLPELGEEVTVRRLSKEALIMSPRLPGSLTSRITAYIKTLDGMPAPETDERGNPKPIPLWELPTEQLLQMPDVVNAILIHTLESPRAVLDGADRKKNQINVEDIPDVDRLFLFAGAMADWPEMPVETEGGAVTIEDLGSFHSGRAGGDVDTDSAGVEGEAIATAGNSIWARATLQGQACCT